MSKETAKVLGLVLRTARVISFLALVTLSAKYQGPDFRKRGLTREQVEIMDSHNLAHDLEQGVDLEAQLANAYRRDFGVEYEPPRTHEKKVASHQGWLDTYNSQMQRLPRSVRHNHK